MTNKIRGSVIDLPQISSAIPTSTDLPAGSVAYNSAGDTPIGWRYSEAQWKPFGSTYLEVSQAWDPPTLAAGAYASVSVPISGADMGDHVLASFSLDITGCVLSASVSSTGNVTAVLHNITAGSINIASGSLRIRVERR